MKKIIVLLMFLLPITMNAQQLIFNFQQVSNCTLNIIDESKVWSMCAPGKTYYYFNGDTIIKGLTYSKLIFGSEFSGICMREESRRVYLYCDPDNDYLYSRDTIDIVLYDFNLQVGDTANMYYNLDDPSKEVVTYVDTAIINGIGRKRVWFWGTCWIEGIGSEHCGILYPMEVNYIDRLYALRCVKQNDELIFGDCDLSCNNSIKTISQMSFMVIPSIVQTQFSIQTDLPIEFQVLVVDMQGRTQLQENVFTGESIDCQCLQAGVYLVAVQDANGRVLAVERIVKQ